MSVLKSFDTQLHFHDSANFTAFDIEDPNWTRAQRWGSPKLLREVPSAGFRKDKGKKTDRVLVWDGVTRGELCSMTARHGRAYHRPLPLSRARGASSVHSSRQLPSIFASNVASCGLEARSGKARDGRVL